MTRFIAFAGVIVLASLGAADTKATVTLEVVKWPALERAIATRKGQVVVIDIWADYCIPCKKEFPHFVELHKKYVGRGLACISVTVDDPEDRDRALKFLEQRQATMANYLLDEPGEIWQSKLDATVPPNVIVIGRDGKRVKRFTSDEPFTYKDVEKIVRPLLDKK